MSAEFYPLYSKPGIKTESGWVFYEADGELQVEDDGEEIEGILYLANGRNAIDRVIEELKQNYDPQKVARIITDLRTLGVIIDNTHAILSRHPYTESPSPYAREFTSAMAEDLAQNDSFVPKAGDVISLPKRITTIGRLAETRESCREFESTKVGVEDIGTCLEAAYSEKHPVPSAGALYPLRIYVIVRDNASDIPGGYYQYDHKESTLIQFNPEPNWEKLKFVFNSEELIHDAPVIFVITADLERQAQKYSSRGYRYTLLEAGHSAQDIHLAATELELGSLEYGGFQDEKVAQELELNLDERPLISIAIGHKSTEHKKDRTQVNEMEKLVGNGKPIDWVKIDLESEGASYMDFFRAFAQYQPIGNSQKKLYSSGTARSMEMAKIKSIAEAYERYMAGKVRWDVVAKAEDLSESWLHPVELMPLTPQQLEDLPHIAEFHKDQAIQWIRAYYKNGGSVLVPIDLVFYPIDENAIGRKIVADVTSSGMAAHPSLEEATERATLELIERDATMRLWFNKKTPNRIDANILPDYIGRRAQFWHEHGRAVDILDLSTNGVAISHVIIRSEDSEFPFFVSGAAASSGSYEVACEKALQEAENLFMGAINSRGIDRIKPEDVKTPEDHGRLYYYEDYKDKIEWLWRGPLVKQISDTDRSASVIDKYNPLVVKLTQDNEYLQVVRVLCPMLVPISFGFGNEYYSHPAIGLTTYQSRSPHFFA